MKNKKSRHESSSDESEDSDASQKSISSSDSESQDSSVEERRHKKKRKHAESSESESDSDDQRRSKKRKHKKKKKKHNKKKRRTLSGAESVSEISSESEGEISKKKRKHKHKHRSSKREPSRSPSVKEISDDEVEEHRLHSVVKERRASSEAGSHPSRTYYQKEYHQSASGEDYESVREKEVQRFYRGSSKERRFAQAQQAAYAYERQHHPRYEDKYKSREKYDKYGPSTHYNNGAGDQYHKPRPKEYEDYKRHQRYEEGPPHEEYHRRPKPPSGMYPRDGHSSQPPKAYNNRYNEYEQRGPRGRPYDDTREYRDRRGPPEERYQGREYPDKKERYREEYHADRARRERPERHIPDPPPPPREYSKSPVPEDRKSSRRPPERAERREREDRPRERGERDDRPRPSDGERRPEVKTERGSPRPRERKSRFTKGDDGKDYEWGKADAKKEETTADKEKPNFGLSGKLTADANTVNGVVLKYTEPDDAKQPKRRWRFYPFKGDKALPILYIHRQSCFVLGRDKKVVDIMLEHPSISKQHSALQFRATPFTRPDGTTGRRVRPYIIDLDSANGTFVNNKKIEARRYVELLERDVVKFGFSAREYVLLHENSKDDAQDDDNQEAPAVITTDKIKQEKRAKEAAKEDGE
ncbi:smad nuclear-interacting protein 1 isoform X1 [Plutella xylostella]|uniref:smad nuclear-interacting protein 1 isoform X1 n=1 Tax=Plutella xylostella TaxID=51655 RepID=UPI0020326665|nr:smad nuclear-interacting protein 1 isoform X1 [Plutella xylostella]